MSLPLPSRVPAVVLRDALNFSRPDLRMAFRLSIRFVRKTMPKNLEIRLFSLPQSLSSSNSVHSRRCAMAVEAAFLDRAVLEHWLAA